MKKILTGIWIVLLLVACESEEDKQALEDMLIQQELERRLVSYERIFFNNCEQKAIDEATRIADSIMIERARLLKDTLGKPSKPDRPEKPELRTLEDSIPVRPFLKDSTKKVKRDTNRN